jgi:hypothetical protein
MAILFEGNDEEYLAWIFANPNGYVLNARKNLKPNYMILHTALCKKVTTYNEMALQGGFTERDFIKVCAKSKGELSSWVRKHGRADGSFSKECSLCNK